MFFVARIVVSHRSIVSLRLQCKFDDQVTRITHLPQQKDQESDRYRQSSQSALQVLLVSTQLVTTSSIRYSRKYEIVKN